MMIIDAPLISSMTPSINALVLTSCHRYYGTTTGNTVATSALPRGHVLNRGG